jgi:hypothetical protein
MYIEGYVAPSANPSIIVGGKNETTTTTSAMTTTSTSFPVANSSWMMNVIGSTVDLGTVTNGFYSMIVYPPDYVYGSTAASSLGGGILKGNYENVILQAYVGNTAYVYQRGSNGTTAYAWPAGAIVNESGLTVSPSDQLVLEDMHLESHLLEGSYSVTGNPNFQEPNAEIELGWMPDQFHTWGTGTGSDYQGSVTEKIEIMGNTRFRNSTMPGSGGVEVHSSGLVMLDQSFKDTTTNGLVSYGSGSSAIQTVTYSNGATSSVIVESPELPSREQIGNIVMTSNGSGQFLMTSAANGSTVCSYNGTVFTCTNGGSTSNAEVTGSTGDAVCIGAVNGTLVDCGVLPGTVTSVAAGSWPTWLTPSVTTAMTTPTLAVTASAIPNSALANSLSTVNGQSCVLGGSCTVAAAAGTLTGTSLASNVVSSSLTSLGTITTGTWHGTAIANGYLVSSATTVNGQSCTLGSSCTVTAAPTAVAFTTLTDGSTVTLATAGAGESNAILTLVHTTATRVLNVTGLTSGASFQVVLKQDSTGGATLTFGTGCTWYLGTNAGFVASTTPALTTTANGINLLAATYDGTNCYANVR